MFYFSFILFTKSLSDNLRWLYECENVTVQSNMLLRIINRHDKISSTCKSILNKHTKSKNNLQPI
jgi:hypothetical protein